MFPGKHFIKLMRFGNSSKSRPVKAAGCISLFPRMRSEVREEGKLHSGVHNMPEFGWKQQHVSLPHRYNPLQICKVCIGLCFAVFLCRRASEIGAGLSATYLPSTASVSEACRPSAVMVFTILLLLSSRRFKLIRKICNKI